MIIEAGQKINNFHDKLRFAKDKFFYPLASALPLSISANSITIFRFALTLIWLPFAILMPKIGQVAVFLVIFFLDSLDGSVARAQNKITRLGSYLDHFSDRINTAILWTLICGLTDFQFLATIIMVFWEIFIAIVVAIDYFLKIKQLNHVKSLLHLIGNTAIGMLLIVEIIKFLSP